MANIGYNTGGMGGTGGQNKMPPLDHILASMDTPGAINATLLPSRDIPMEQFPPSQLDPSVRYEYADTTLLDAGPSASRKRQQYIADEEDEVAPTKSVAVNFDTTYNVLQVPIFLAVLFFIFQLPVIKKWQFNYLPFIFAADGNWNVGGIALNSAIFAGVYFLLQKVLAF